MDIVVVDTDRQTDGVREGERKRERVGDREIHTLFIIHCKLY